MDNQNELKVKEIANGTESPRFCILYGGLRIHSYFLDGDAVLRKVRNMINFGMNPDRIMIRREVVTYHEFAVSWCSDDTSEKEVQS